jgi:hypothetical protein
MGVKIERLKPNFIYFLLVIPAIIFGIYIFFHAVNLPYMDDMELIKTINDIRENPSSLFSVLMRQQNDHRIAFARLGIIAETLVTGEIDFRFTILLGFLNLLFLCFGFYLIFRSQNKPLLYFLPVALLLFSPFIFQAHLWSITSFQYTLSIGFSIVCLHFLKLENGHIWLYSLFFVIAAPLANLDGLSILPIGIFWLVCQRRNKEAFIFSALSVSYLVFFFSDFKLSSASHLTFSLESFSQIALCILAITGSFAKII